MSRHQISIRTMNFSQDWRTPGVVDLRYRVEIPTDFLLWFLPDRYIEFVEDARRFPDPQDLLEASLLDRGFPDLHVALFDSGIAPHLLDFWGLDILNAWFSGQPDLTKLCYVLNTFESLGLDNLRCWFMGQCRDSRHPVVFQDE